MLFDHCRWQKQPFPKKTTVFNETHESQFSTAKRFCCVTIRKMKTSVSLFSSSESNVLNRSGQLKPNKRRRVSKRKHEILRRTDRGESGDKELIDGEHDSWVEVGLALNRTRILQKKLIIFRWRSSTKQSTKVEVPESNISRQKWNRFAAEKVLNLRWCDPRLRLYGLGQKFS